MPTSLRERVKKLSMKNINMRLALAALALSVAPLASLAQGSAGFAQGVDLFDGGRYAQARERLAACADAYDRDAKFNFYFGAAEAMTGRNLDDALRRLHLAQLRGFRKADANLYIGRAYQLQCEYDQARSALAKFRQTCKVDSLAALAERYDAECQSSVALAGRIFGLRVAGKTCLPRRSVTKAYAAGKECGSVCANSRFFQSDIDPDGVMYMTERADAVYFSLPAEDGFERLMKMEKLIGGWGDMTALRGLDGEWNDITPVLMTDGVTVYFASDRPGGMGGYDIYRTTYDPETRTFSSPVNMGVPFNSAFDDFLFMPDEFNGRAWFASDREVAGTDSVMVYEIDWSAIPVRSTARSTADIQDALALAQDPQLTPTSRVQDSERRTMVRDRSFAPRAAFRFQVCDSLTYTQWEHFRSAQAARTYRQVANATAEKDSLVALMAAQRKEFMSLASSIERNAKLQDLLKTERSIYTLEDEIAEKAEAARNEEIEHITRLVAEGTYTPLAKIKVVNRNAPKLTGTNWLRPGRFSVFSPVFFREAHADEDEDVMNLFTAQQRSIIQEQDSMLAWANIVSLEARKLDASALSPETTDEDAAALVGKADAYRMAAARLASDAYDQLVSVYEAKYRVILATLGGYDSSELDELHAKARASIASIAPDDVASPEADKRDALIASKRRAVSSLVKCMQRYAVHADGSFPLPASDADGGVSLPAADEPEAVPAQQAEVQPTSPTEDAASSAAVQHDAADAPDLRQDGDTADGHKPFRIQLGAFKRPPAALKALPDATKVSSVFISERGITRYYYGAYGSAAEAEADIAVARKAGFTGAFAVRAE